MCEQSLNQEDTIGFRWTLVGDQAGQAFRRLASYMVPVSGSVQAHSTAQLLKKVLDAIDLGSDNKPLSYHGGATAAKPLKAVKDESDKSKSKGKGKGKGKMAGAVKAEEPVAKKRRT